MNSQKGNNMDYEIRPVHAHFEIYINGKFYCSADSMAEAMREVEKLL